jgi:hypothetical protein
VKLGGRISPLSAHIWLSRALRLGEDFSLRDVGVAGSNPVTPTTDFHRVFAPVLAHGSRYFRIAVPKMVPVFGAGKPLNDSAVLGRRNIPGAKISDEAFQDETMGPVRRSLL